MSSDSERAMALPPVITEASEPASSPPAPALQLPEASKVEIHKVKPIHSWRDFMKELGTIVLGIVIAISMEHLVQEWSWDHEVKEARQALLAEISANNENLLAFRIAVAPCIQKQIDDITKLLAALDAGVKPEPISLLRAPPGGLTRDSEWQAERASQVLTHFPRQELAIMSRYYAQLPDLRGWAADETVAWRELGNLEKSPTGMTPAEVNGLRVALRTAVDSEFLIVLNARRQLALSKRLGMADTLAPDKMRIQNFCTMTTEQYRRYRSSQDLR
jgi:hypothetical protein